MTTAIAHDQQQEWPTLASSTLIDPHLERDAATVALEDAWRNGALAGIEPAA